MAHPPLTQPAPHVAARAAGPHWPRAGALWPQVLAAVTALLLAGLYTVPVWWAPDGSRDLHVVVLVPALLAAWAALLAAHVRLQMRVSSWTGLPPAPDPLPERGPGHGPGHELERRLYRVQRALQRKARELLDWVTDPRLHLPTWTLVVSLLLVLGAAAALTAVLSRALGVQGSLERGALCLRLGWHTARALTLKVKWDAHGQLAGGGGEAGWGGPATA